MIQASVVTLYLQAGSSKRGFGILWGGGVEGGADNVLVNLTICEDFVKIPKTHNRYLSKFPGDARHRAKPSRQVFAMSIASSSLPERF